MMNKILMIDRDVIKENCLQMGNARGQNNFFRIITSMDIQREIMQLRQKHEIPEKGYVKVLEKDTYKTELDIDDFVVINNKYKHFKDDIGELINKYSLSPDWFVSIANFVRYGRFLNFPLAHDVGKDAKLVRAVDSKKDYAVALGVELKDVSKYEDEKVSIELTERGVNILLKSKGVFNSIVEMEAMIMAYHSTLAPPDPKKKGISSYLVYRKYLIIDGLTKRLNNEEIWQTINEGFGSITKLSTTDSVSKGAVTQEITRVQQEYEQLRRK